MFAPEEVFTKKTPKPRGFYYPSPVITSEPIPKSQCATHTSNMTPKTPKVNLNNVMNRDNIDVVNKENKKTKVKSINTCVIKEDASTSIDKLLRDIDDSLASSIQPSNGAPIARDLADLNQILSVSNASDANTSVMSPENLRFYIDRFKHSNPSHPSTRKDQVSRETNSLLTYEEGIKIVDNAISTSGEESLFYNSIELDSSSFLNLQLSSDDSTIYSLTSSSHSGPGEIESCSSAIVDLGKTTANIKNVSDDIKMTAPNVRGSTSSYIQQLTGRTLSELKELVPKEVIEPSCDNEDILFQWRLKRRIADAKSNPPLSAELPSNQNDSALPQRSKQQAPTQREFFNLDSSKDINKVPSPCKNNVPKPIFSPQIQIHESSSAAPLSTKTSREVDVQTDKEKYDISCQVNIKSSPKCPRNFHRSPATTPTKRLSKGSPIRLKSSPQMRNVSKSSPCKKVIFNSTGTYESDSEISLSSLSDDLTNISDLEDCMFQEDDLGDVADFENDEPDKQLDVTLKENDIEHEERPDGFPVSQENLSDHANTYTDSVKNVHYGANHNEVDTQTKNVTEKAEESYDEGELRKHLENIAETFDDELLTSFIQKYNDVLDKIKCVDAIIKEKSHEH